MFDVNYLCGTMPTFALNFSRPLAITIVGIPLVLGNLKLVPISLTPFGRTIVPVDQARATGAAFF